MRTHSACTLDAQRVPERSWGIRVPSGRERGTQTGRACMSELPDKAGELTLVLRLDASRCCIPLAVVIRRMLKLLLRVYWIKCLSVEVMSNPATVAALPDEAVEVATGVGG